LRFQESYFCHERVCDKSSCEESVKGKGYERQGEVNDILIMSGSWVQMVTVNGHESMGTPPSHMPLVAELPPFLGRTTHPRDVIVSSTLYVLTWSKSLGGPIRVLYAG